MPRRYTEEEVERTVIPRLVDAIYPILIPFEQQDMRIQADNHKLVTEIATAAWRTFAQRA